MPRDAADDRSSDDDESPARSMAIPTQMVGENNVSKYSDKLQSSRVMLSQRTATGAPSAPVSSSSSAGAPAGAVPSLAELNATVQKQAVELRRLTVVQRRRELEEEFIKAELARIRRDVKKLAAGGSLRSAGDRSPAPAPDDPPPKRLSSRVLTVEDTELITRRLRVLEEQVNVLQEHRINQLKAAVARDKESTDLGTSPLACVDDHFPAEPEDVTPTENGRLTEPLGFNLDDLALSDSDDH
ncbi:uncharacterized protein LOC122389688 isoform X3 [Amphibalanus amphitrite]|uniref:uncharacterized protein LOC122389688 isoform X3 n=1 Tax=Amphibalanus amphitrite TaxID=1232801 RepID=UPI001C901734|nr:uncharacterized protein LOC122389688 isoform X3 [Amphibalanus amphitrite]